MPHGTPLVVAALLAASSFFLQAQSAGDPAEAEVRGNAERGAELFGVKGCNGCHTIDGVGGQVGPNLSQVVTLDLAKDRSGREWPNIVAYIRESLRDPQAYIVPNFPNPSPMPTASEFELSAQDIDDLITYLFSVADKSDAK